MQVLAYELRVGITHKAAGGYMARYYATRTRNRGCNNTIIETILRFR